MHIWNPHPFGHAYNFDTFNVGINSFGAIWRLEGTWSISSSTES